MAQEKLITLNNLSTFKDDLDIISQASLDGKVDKEVGKGLSTNDFTDTYKSNVDSNTSARHTHSNKSVLDATTASYTTTEQTKLSGIETGANKTVVDSAMSDSSTNPLQNKVITKELEGTKTTSGNPLTIEDAAPVNAVNLNIDLEPIQDLHGYDHPWVGGAGKNKWNGSVSTSNVFSSAFALPASLLNFTISLKNDSGKQINGVVYNSSGTKIVSDFVIAMASATSGTKNITVSEQAYLCIYTTSASGSDASKVTDVQVESGSTATSYEPYSNICPISGRSESSINDLGDNLFDKTAITDNAYLNTDNGNTSPNNDYCVTDYIPISKGQSIHIPATDTTRRWFYNSAKAGTTFLNNKNEQVFTATEDGFIRVSIHKTVIDINTFQINYIKTYTIQLGETVYGGQLDVTRGKMVVDKGYAEFDGSSDESLSLQSINSHGIANFSIDGAHFNPQRADGEYCITNEFKKQTTLIAYTTTMGFLNGPTFYIRILSSYASTVSEFRTWLSNNPLQVVYELATPFTIDLTPQQIKMLENTNTISTDYDGDTITLEYQPNNAIGEAVRVVEENYETRVSLLENRNTAKVYGFHISSTESDPAAKVTYLADAVGMTPARMNFSTGKFDYGSWEDVWFVRDTKPCLLKDNGQIHCYLNKNNFLKDIDGNDTGVPQITIHTMIEFPKIWYKVVPDIDGKGASIYISPVKVDADYVDYPYIDYQGVHKEHFYMPAYNGSTQTESGTTYLCSTYGETVSKSLTAEQEITYCKAHGNGWNTEDAGSIMLINFLLILMGKSTDVQSVFGQGLHTSGTEAINNGFTTGIHYNKGMFYGTNSGTIASNNYSNAVKVFGIENYWGFQWRRYAGDILVDGVRKIKLCYGNEDGSSTFDYNLTGNGYVNVGVTPSGTSGGYISEMKFTNTGMYSKVSIGSSSTHYCDGQWYNNSGTRYAFHGGYTVDGALCGAFYVSLNAAASTAWWSLGVGLEYK